ETYLQKHPEIQQASQYALEVIYQEVILRQERGEAAPLEEYLKRSPQYSSQLPPLSEVHQALEARSACDFVSAKTFRYATVSARAALADPKLPAVPGYELLKELGRGA